MKINGNINEMAILEEIGQRIKQYRIAMNITQSDLANRCGISSSTEVRIENGEDSKLSNYIKILSAFNMTENLDVLLPETQPSFKDLFEEKPTKKRVKLKGEKKHTDWVWEEDK